MEEREPDADEIEAMRASEWAFRLDNYLLDDHAYSAYCEAYAEWWYQFDPPSEEFLAEMRKRAEAPIMRNEAEPPPAETAAVSRGVQVNAIASTGDVPIVRRGKRDQYELTPPEAKFYDALVETGLTFSIQPWTQHVETTFRPDFFVHYGGKVYVVEINGYQFHSEPSRHLPWSYVERSTPGASR